MAQQVIRTEWHDSMTSKNDIEEWQIEWHWRISWQRRPAQRSIKVAYLGYSAEDTVTNWHSTVANLSST